MDIVLIEKLINEGLELQDVIRLLANIKDNNFLPIEIENNQKSVALGFITISSADKMNFDYESYGLNKFIKNILNDVFQEKDLHTHFYFFKNFRIYLMR